MAYSLVDIIIVNWNGGSYLRKCVEAVLKSSYTNFIIHIVDNGSTDQSLESLPEDKRIHIISKNKNLGFGRACNEALQFCKGEFILLLNPDTIVEKDSIRKAILFINTHSDTSVYGCLQLTDENKILRVCGRFPNFFTFCNEALGLFNISPKIFINGFAMKEWDHTTSKYVDHVMGAFYLIRRSLTDEVGFMDDRFFVYMEDLDLSYRIRRKGGKIYYDASNPIYHKGGGVSSSAKARRLFYALHAKHVFIKKNFDPITFLLSDFILIFISPFARLFNTSLIIRSRNETRETIEAYKLFYKHLLFRNVLE